MCPEHPFLKKDVSDSSFWTNKAYYCFFYISLQQKELTYNAEKNKDTNNSTINHVANFCSNTPLASG